MWINKPYSALKDECFQIQPYFETEKSSEENIRENIYYTKPTKLTQIRGHPIPCLEKMHVQASLGVQSFAAVIAEFEFVVDFVVSVVDL